MSWAPVTVARVTQQHQLDAEGLPPPPLAGPAERGQRGDGSAGGPVGWDAQPGGLPSCVRVLRGALAR
jgi:hypothetical protein